MLRDDFKLKGTVTAVLYGADGQVKFRHTYHNLIVNVGKNKILNRLDANTALAFGSGNANTRMALGSDGTAADVAQTTLGAEPGTLTGAGGVRSALDSSTVSGQQITYVATFATNQANGSIAEMGLFDATAVGNMLNRVVFSPVITKSSSDTLQLTYTVSL